MSTALHQNARALIHAMSYGVVNDSNI